MAHQTFEQEREIIKQAVQEEIQVAITENKKACLCAFCPSYDGTGESEFLFCTLSKSKVQNEERGCPCPVCPVQKKMAREWDYYCTKGSGTELLQQEAS